MIQDLTDILFYDSKPPHMRRKPVLYALQSSHRVTTNLTIHIGYQFKAMYEQHKIPVVQRQRSSAHE